jgi:hypothetical protein
VIATATTITIKTAAMTIYVVFNAVLLLSETMAGNLPALSHFIIEYLLACHIHHSGSLCLHHLGEINIKLYFVGYSIMALALYMDCLFDVIWQAAHIYLWLLQRTP